MIESTMRDEWIHNGCPHYHGLDPKPISSLNYRISKQYFQSTEHNNLRLQRKNRNKSLSNLDDLVLGEFQFPGFGDLLQLLLYYAHLVVWNAISVMNPATWMAKLSVCNRPCFMYSTGTQLTYMCYVFIELLSSHSPNLYHLSFLHFPTLLHKRSRDTNPQFCTWIRADGFSSKI